MAKTMNNNINNIKIKGGMNMVNKTRVLEKGALNRQSLLKVYILPEGRVEFDIIEISTGAIHDRCRCSNREVIIDGIKKTCKNFNEEVIVLNLNGIAGTEYVGLFTGDIVIDLEGRDVYYHDRNGVFRSWKAPKNTISESEVRGLIRVKPALMSPSQEKKQEVTCVVCDEEDFENKMDRLTDGLFSIIKRVYEKTDYEKLVKLVGYMATGLAPSRKFEYSINSIAILMSKSRMADGAGFIKAKGAIPVGIGVQARNFGSDKGHYLSIKEEVMKEYVDNFAEKVRIKEVTPEIQKTFEEAFVRENEFSGKLLIIGEGTPDLFLDMNIVKTPFDLARFRRNELRVLDISISKNDEIAFGSQMAQTLIMNNKAKEVLTRKIEESLRSYIEDFCDKEAEVLLTFNQFIEGLEYIPGLIEKINPGMKLVDPALYRVARETLYNKITSILSEFRIPTGGTFARVFCDFAEDFGEKILKENEIFSPDLEKKGVKYAVGIRSPKGGLFEFNVYKIVDKKELNRRIRKSKRLRGSVKGILIKLFGSIKPGSGLAVVPASKFIMLLHSGMDFDYDGMSLFHDKDVVELFSGIRPTALLVEDEGNTSQSAESFSIENYMATVIKGQFANPNLPVGVVCNHAHTWLSLMSNLDFARTVLKQMFGLGRETTYEPLERESLEVGDLVRIDAKKVEEILTRVKNINFDKAPDKAIIDILIDINHVMNRFIQKTIDASKTGESIVIPEELLVNDVVDNLSLRQMRITSSRISKRQMAVADGLYIEVEPKGASYQVINKDGKVIYAFSDFIHEVRKEALRRVLPELKKIATYEPKLGPELAAARQTVLNKLDKGVRNDLILFKKYYGDLTGHRTTSISKINETHSRFIRDELIRRVNKDYKASLEYLANSIRLATASMNPIERILALMGIASNPREGMDAPSSSMPLNTLGEEYIILASKFGGTKFIGERIRGVDAEIPEGTVVTVQNGMIGGNLIVDLPDGEYTIKHIDGTVYAVKTIEEVVNELELMKLNNKLMIRLSSGLDIDLADIPNEAKIVTWKYAGRDAFGDLAIDLAAGCTPYSKILANVIAQVDKAIKAEVLYRNGKGLSTILCLSAKGREGKKPSSAKKVKVTTK